MYSVTVEVSYDICWAETESSGADESLVAVLGDLVESVSPMDDHESNHIGQTPLALFKSIG